MTERIWTTQCPQATREVAAEIAHAVINTGMGTHAVVVTLAGDLGAGKTTFAQGFLEACGAEGPFTSPTFGIIKEYTIAQGGFTKVYHIDPYRVGVADLRALSWAEMADEVTSIILLEWPSIVADLVPDDAVRVQLTHVDEQTRAITVTTVPHAQGRL